MNKAAYFVSQFCKQKDDDESQRCADNNKQTTQDPNSCYCVRLRRREALSIAGVLPRCLAVVSGRHIFGLYPLPCLQIIQEWEGLLKSEAYLLGGWSWILRAPGLSAGPSPLPAIAREAVGEPRSALLWPFSCIVPSTLLHFFTNRDSLMRHPKAFYKADSR